MVAVRALDAVGDMQWGRGRADFLVDVPEAVAQRAKTRMALWFGDWFLNLAEGTPYRTAVLGARTNATRDPALRARILGTAGCTGITVYASQVNRATRVFSVQCTISTAFGTTLVASANVLPNGDVRYVR